MRNKYTYIVLLAWLMLGVACRDADKEMYSDDTVGLYFKLANLSDDSTLVVNRSAQSVTYTFVYDDADVTEREICIPVQVFGDSAAYNRKYRIEVSLPPIRWKERIMRRLRRNRVSLRGKPLIRCVWCGNGVRQ